MYRIVLKLASSLLLSVIAPPTWATEIYQCRDAVGRVSFQETACYETTYVEQQGRAAREQASRERVELLAREIVSVKRELMDLERRLEFGLSRVEEEERSAFESSITEQRQALKTQLRQLKVRRTDLLEELFRVAG